VKRLDPIADIRLKNARTLCAGLDNRNLRIVRARDGSMRQPTAENVIANPVSSLGAPALAFLAGYGVEAVFRMLDGLADQISAAPR
jgi:hypothetical protein